MTSHTMSLEFLMKELASRSSRASTSFLSPADPALRRHLVHRFDHRAGMGDSFIADPVCEPLFPWEPSKQTFGDLSGTLLHPKTVAALATDFKPTDFPYTHQIESWKVLLGKECKSLMVTSGTGSGKTECFLVPILDSLVRQSEAEGPLSGVQALFLYPLNALIESQKTRLSAWCKPLGGKVRFGLYNGTTPQTEPAATKKAAPEQAIDRDTIRHAPPSLLVTNASMLEYVLVRPEDQPLLAASKGKLRWVVIDEAHTYLGSNAAEIALLLRRVLHAFGADPAQVRFIATSATIGNDANTASALKVYLANLAGIDPGQVEVIGGQRQVRPLPPAQGASTLSEVRVSPDGDRYAKLVNLPEARAFRQALTERKVARVSELQKLGKLPDLRTTVELLDLCHRARSDGLSFLPVRMHFFHRTQVGLWCCINPSCKGKEGDPSILGWGFGSIFMEHRVGCPHCDSLVYELCLCSACGEHHLEGVDSDADGKGALVIPAEVAASDEESSDEAPEEEDGDQDPSTQSHSRRRFLHRPFDHARKLEAGEQPRYLDRTTGLLGPSGADMVDVHVLHEARCLRCGARETVHTSPIRPVRIGAPFFLRTAVPVLLEQAEADPKPLQKPLEGRRTLTFTDSRQGSAAFALSTQMDSERNFIRSWLWHVLSSAKPASAEDPVPRLEAMINALEAGKAAEYLIAPLRKELADAKSPQVHAISWQEAATRLADTSTVKHVIKENWRARYSPVTAEAVAHTLLMRELMRRPQRSNSVETLGIAALDYPAIDAGLPAAAKSLGLGADDWRSLVRLCLDQVVRNGWALHLDDGEYGLVQRRWLGLRPRSYVLVGPHGEKLQEKSVFWPRAKLRNGQPSRMASLLALATKTPLEDARIAEALEAAWEAALPVLTVGADGYRLDLVAQAVIVAVRKAWRCPVTRRVLPVTLCGWSPYVPLPGTKYGPCEPVEFPAVRFPFGRDEKGAEVKVEEVRAWLETDPSVLQLREKGVWGDLHDKFSYRPDVILTAEHSAQQSPAKLQAYTAAFKEGRLNILSCSTTMEMGVDIGGLSTVAMNNAPPGPANFFQRAGRAGRRGESAAASLTMCKATPHGEAVFRDPKWPWTTPLVVPRVALNSEPIIRRHLAALTLGTYLEGRPAHRLTMEWFFRPPPPPEEGEAHATLYAAWLADEKTAGLLDGALRVLVARTPLQGQPSSKLLELVRQDFLRVRTTWLEQDAAAEQEWSIHQKALKPGEESSPAMKAATIVLKRLRKEYLLGELTQRCFLPVHGFPTGLAQFITTTIEDLKRAEAEQSEGADAPGRRAYPTRDLPIAIREYAPGTARIIDGKVYRSAGVTLNWQIPPGAADVKEVQQFKHFWRCRDCGADGVNLLWQKTCSQCGSEKLRRSSFLAPAGFAVDLMVDPTNDDSEQVFAPIQPPHVSGSGPWVALADPELGAHRLTQEGRILHLHEGERGHGYAICLACGRAAAEDEPASGPGEPMAPLPAELVQHYRLRGGKQRNADGRCTGNDSEWLVKRHHALGAEVTSSIFELRLRPLQSGRTSIAALGAIAIAMRQAAADRLGIEVRELNWAIVPPHGEAPPSIALFDAAAGGAGYAPQLPDLIDDLLVGAQRVLQCKRNCDVACHACVLSFETQHAVREQRVDRKAGLELLTPEVLAKLQPGPDLKALLGPDARLEVRPLSEAIELVLQEGRARAIRVSLHGNPKAWELTNWHVTDAMWRWLGLGLDVTLQLPTSSMTLMPDAVRGYLHSLHDLGSIKLQAVEALGPTIVVEIDLANEHVRFATSTENSRSPSEDWGTACQVMRLRQSGALPSTVGTAIPLAALEVKPTDKLTEIRRCRPTGPIGDWGAKVLHALLAVSPDAKARIEAKAPIALIQYDDYCLQSPLGLRIIKEIFKAIAYTQKPKTLVRTENKDKKKADAVNAYRFDLPAPILSDVGRTFLKKHFAESSDFRVEPPATLDHMRVLKVRWEDGKTWQVKFDGGVAFEIHTPSNLVQLAQERTSVILDRLEATFSVAPPGAASWATKPMASTGSVPQRPQPVIIVHRIE